MKRVLAGGVMLAALLASAAQAQMSTAVKQEE